MRKIILTCLLSLISTFVIANTRNENTNDSIKVIDTCYNSLEIINKITREAWLSTIVPRLDYSEVKKSIIDAIVEKSWTEVLSSYYEKVEEVAIEEEPKIIPETKIIEDFKVPVEVMVNIAYQNYIQYSIAKILSSENKAIADEEYNQIIKDIKIELLNDTLLASSYRIFFNGIDCLGLEQNEEEFLTRMDEEQRKDTYKASFTDIKSMFDPKADIKKTIANRIYTYLTYSYASQNTTQATNIEKELSHLDINTLSSVYSTHKELSAASDSCLKYYKSVHRIDSGLIDKFVIALSEKDINNKISALKELELFFNEFPPYWYELGNAYQSSGKNEDALNCYDKFEQLKENDAISSNYNITELAKNKILIYLGDNADKVFENADINKENILKYAGLIEASISDSTFFAEQVYLSQIYFLVGENGKCLERIENAIEYSNKGYTGVKDELLLFKRLLMSEPTINPKTFTQYRLANIASEITWSKKSIEDNQNSVKNYKGIKFATNSLYLFLPKQIVDIYANCNVDIQIDGVSYRTHLAKDHDGSFLCIVTGYDIKDIKDQATIHIKFIEEKSNRPVCDYTFLINKFDNYDIVQKAYNRIGSDINYHNAQFSYLFGDEIKDYNYIVKNDEKERVSIKENLTKANEKNKKTGNAKSQKELSKLITDEIYKALQEDIYNIQSILSSTQSTYDKSEETMFEPKHVNYNGQHYLIGLVEITNPNTKADIKFDSNYDLRSSSKE